jgi:hypothetical protein
MNISYFESVRVAVVFCARFDPDFSRAVADDPGCLVKVVGARDVIPVKDGSREMPADFACDKRIHTAAYHITDGRTPSNRGTSASPRQPRMRWPMRS